MDNVQKVNNFINITSSQNSKSYFLEKRLLLNLILYPEDGGSRFLRNVNKILTGYNFHSHPCEKL
jgi:hypothetical protein